MGGRDYFLHIYSGSSAAAPFHLLTPDFHNGNTSESFTALDSELTPELPVDALLGTAPLTRLCPCSVAGSVISKLWLIRLMEGSGGGDKNQEDH